MFWLGITCNITVKVDGLQNIPKQAVVILSNHQSPWETIYFYSLFTPVAAILKKELLSIPFFGWALALLKPIAIDRKRKLTARQAILDQGSARLDSGISILIFPEGTRVSVGDKKKFQTGGAVLAIDCGYDVLPVAHNAGEHWPARQFLKYPGTIKVVVGPIKATEGYTPRELTQEVEDWIAKTK